MKLMIAEKPSVARAIASVVGADSRGDGYLEGGGWVVTWCRGHLVDLCRPDAYEQWAGAWDLAKLPMLPDPWKWAPAGSDAEERLSLIKELAERPDVTEIVNACDADRESFRFVRVCGESAEDGLGVALFDDIDAWASMMPLDGISESDVPLLADMRAQKQAEEEARAEAEARASAGAATGAAEE